MYFVNLTGQVQYDAPNESALSIDTSLAQINTGLQGLGPGSPPGQLLDGQFFQTPKISKIFDGLFVGNADAGMDMEFLLSNKVMGVINCCSQVIPNSLVRFDVKYLSLRWEHEKRQAPMFDAQGKTVQRIVKFIDRTRVRGGAILIQSLHGTTRAIYALVAYFVHKFEWSILKALEFIGSKRIGLFVRPMFLKQLAVACLALRPNKTLTEIEGREQSLHERWAAPPKTPLEMVIANTYLNSRSPSALDPFHPPQAKTVTKSTPKRRIQWWDGTRNSAQDIVPSDYASVQDPLMTQQRHSEAVNRNKRAALRQQLEEKEAAQQRRQQQQSSVFMTSTVANADNASDSSDDDNAPPSNSPPKSNREIKHGRPATPASVSPNAKGQISPQRMRRAQQQQQQPNNNMRQYRPGTPAALTPSPVKKELLGGRGKAQTSNGQQLAFSPSNDWGQFSVPASSANHDLNGRTGGLVESSSSPTLLQPNHDRPLSSSQRLSSKQPKPMGFQSMFAASSQSLQANQRKPMVKKKKKAAVRGKSAQGNRAFPNRQFGFTGGKVVVRPSSVHQQRPQSSQSKSSSKYAPRSSNQQWQSRSHTQSTLNRPHSAAQALRKRAAYGNSASNGNSTASAQSWFGGGSANTLNSSQSSRPQSVQSNAWQSYSVNGASDEAYAPVRVKLTSGGQKNPFSNAARVYRSNEKALKGKSKRKPKKDFTFHALSFSQRK